MDRQAMVEKLREHFEADSRIVAVYLFGSVARGTQRPDSDIDIGVLFRTAPPSTLLGQPYLDEAQLAEALGRPVQVVAMNSAPADLVHRILRDGDLVVETDKSHRLRFEVKSRNEYFDLLPIWHRYRQRYRP